MHFFFQFRDLSKYILEHPNFIVSNSMDDSINNKRFTAIALDVPFLKILMFQKWASSRENLSLGVCE